ncbi:MAG: FKBP-type peptidyl-prolyl cis-trans isomerase [Saprospiraceae bacterium]
MKNLIFLFSAILLMAFCIACGGGENETGGSKNGAALVSEMDSMCYAIGTSFSKSVSGQQLSLDGGQVAKGYMECKSGSSYINEDNARQETGRLQQAYRMKQSTSPDGTVKDFDFDSLSYAIGSSYFLQLKSLGMELNDEALLQGIKDNLQEGGGLLDDLQVRSLLQRFRAISEKAQDEKNAVAAAENLAKGKAFMEEKAKEEGVKSTPSGLHYKVLKSAQGKSPTAANTVSVHYEGRLIDGTVFDSSIARGQPIEFSLGGVIKGWTEGLQLMKVGEKFQFYIPADLAYGNRGSAPKIGPGETLIFDVELLDVK